jgi:hypothetical protein
MARPSDHTYQLELLNSNLSRFHVATETSPSNAQTLVLVLAWTWKLLHAKKMIGQVVLPAALLARSLLAEKRNAGGLALIMQ